MPNMKREGNKSDDRPALHLMWCRFFYTKYADREGHKLVENSRVSEDISKAMEIKV